MKLIVGLGNPGEKYKNNRHNAGYFVIDKLKAEKLKDTLVFKTDTFMNESGEAVKKLVEQYGVSLSNVWVIHDDLDIPLGSYKIQFGVGPKVHRGITDVEEKLGTKDFWRVRIGVDNRDPDEKTPGEEYVLQDFTKDELEKLKRVVDEVCKKLATF